MILNMKLNIRKMRSDNYSLNNVEKPLWNEWESNAIIFYSWDLKNRLLNEGFDTLSTKNIRYWLYNIGINAGDFIAKKQYDQIQIRFRNASDIAFLKMSGIIE